MTKASRKTSKDYPPEIRARAERAKELIADVMKGNNSTREEAIDTICDFIVYARNS